MLFIIFFFLSLLFCFLLRGSKEEPSMIREIDEIRDIILSKDALAPIVVSEHIVKLDDENHILNFIEKNHGNSKVYKILTTHEENPKYLTVQILHHNQLWSTEFFSKELCLHAEVLIEVRILIKEVLKSLKSS